MRDPDGAMDERLARLREETRGLGARPGFDARVMQALAAEAALRATPAWLREIASAAWPILAVAGLVALGGGGLAFQSDRSADQSLARSFTALTTDALAADEAEGAW